MVEQLVKSVKEYQYQNAGQKIHGHAEKIGPDHRHTLCQGKGYCPSQLRDRCN